MSIALVDTLILVGVISSSHAATAKSDYSYRFARAKTLGTVTDR